MTITACNLGRKCMEEIEVPVLGVVEDKDSGRQWPLLGLKMMDDEKWNRLCEAQMREQPELYTEV